MKQWSWKKKLLVGLVVVGLLSLVVPWPWYEPMKCGNRWKGDYTGCPEKVVDWQWHGPIIWEVYKWVVIGDYDIIDNYPLY